MTPFDRGYAAGASAPLLQHLCGYLKGAVQEIPQGHADMEAEGLECTKCCMPGHAAVLLLSPLPQTLQQLAAALQTGELQGCICVSLLHCHRMLSNIQVWRN